MESSSVISSSQSSALTSDEVETVSLPPRDELLESFQVLIKEKRDLRKRNAKIQTCIVQYIRKYHKTDLTPSKDPTIEEKMKEEYSKLLEKLIYMNDVRSKEKNDFKNELNSISIKKFDVDSDIYCLKESINQLKLQATNHSRNNTDSKSLSQQILINHQKVIAQIQQEAEPHRLEMVKLMNTIEKLEKKFASIDKLTLKENSDVDVLGMVLENNAIAQKTTASQCNHDSLQKRTDSMLHCVKSLKAKTRTVELQNEKILSKIEHDEKVLQRLNDDYHHKKQILSIQLKVKNELKSNLIKLESCKLIKD